MAIIESLKTSVLTNQTDDKSDDVCPECGSGLEGEICPDCDIDGKLDEEESPLETVGDNDEDWIK